MIYKALSHLTIDNKMVTFHCVNPFADDLDPFPTVKVAHGVDDIPDPADIMADVMSWLNGELIQESFPYLYPAERETLLTGFLPEDWENIDDLGE